MACKLRVVVVVIFVVVVVVVVVIALVVLVSFVVVDIQLLIVVLIRLSLSEAASFDNCARHFVTCLGKHHFSSNHGGVMLIRTDQL